MAYVEKHLSTNGKQKEAEEEEEETRLHSLLSEMAGGNVTQGRAEGALGRCAFCAFCENAHFLTPSHHTPSSKKHRSRKNLGRSRHSPPHSSSANGRACGAPPYRHARARALSVSCWLSCGLLWQHISIHPSRRRETKNFGICDIAG